MTSTIEEQRRWERNLKAALILVRDFRLKAVKQSLDGRAVRVALKYAILVDTHLARRQGLTPEEDDVLDRLAEQLFDMTPQVQWSRRSD